MRYTARKYRNAIVYLGNRRLLGGTVLWADPDLGQVALVVRDERGRLVREGLEGRVKTEVLQGEVRVVIPEKVV